MNKQSNPSANGACNWNSRELASWSKQAPVVTPQSAPSGLRYHQAKLQEAVVQAKAV